MNGKLNLLSDCTICHQRLIRNADLGDETNDIEVLVEQPRCGHAFHRTCLAKTVKAGGRNCPSCRTAIASKVLRRLGEDDSLNEGERQRLGLYDADSQLNEWYRDQRVHARANNAENDDFSSDPESGDDLVNDDDWENQITIYDGENRQEIASIINLLNEDFRNIRDYTESRYFHRLANYILEMSSYRATGCKRLVEILKILPRSYLWTNGYLNVARNIAMSEPSVELEDGVKFPNCMNRIIEYLREIGLDDEVRKSELMIQERLQRELAA